MSEGGRWLKGTQVAGGRCSCPLPSQLLGKGKKVGLEREVGRGCSLPSPCASSVELARGIELEGAADRVNWGSEWEKDPAAGERVKHAESFSVRWSPRYILAVGWGTWCIALGERKWGTHLHTNEESQGRNRDGESIPDCYGHQRKRVWCWFEGDMGTKAKTSVTRTCHNNPRTSQTAMQGETISQSTTAAQCEANLYEVRGARKH